MTVKQLSVFIENRPGRLSAVTKILGDNDVNIRAMSLADTKDFGILSLENRGLFRYHHSGACSGDK